MTMDMMGFIIEEELLDGAKYESVATISPRRTRQRQPVYLADRGQRGELRSSFDNQNPIRDT